MGMLLLFKKGALCFNVATHDLEFSDKEEHRKSIQLMENKLLAMKKDLEKVIEERKEINFNNFNAIFSEIEEILSKATSLTTKTEFTSHEEFEEFCNANVLLKSKIDRKINYFENLKIPRHEFEIFEKYGFFLQSLKEVSQFLAFKSSKLNETLEISHELLQMDKILSSMVENVQFNLKNLDRSNLHGPTIEELDRQFQIILECLRDLEDNILRMKEHNFVVLEHEEKIVKTNNSIKILKEMLEKLKTKSLELIIKMKELEMSIGHVESLNNDATFQLDLYRSRGYVDIQRLKNSLDYIKEFEQTYKSNEENLRKLKSSFGNIEDQLDDIHKQDISGKIKEKTMEYERISDEYKDIQANYQDAILLLEKYNTLCVSIKTWVTESTVLVTKTQTQIELQKTGDCRDIKTLQREVEKHEDIIKDINDILAGVIQKV